MDIPIGKGTNLFEIPHHALLHVTAHSCTYRTLVNFFCDCTRFEQGGQEQRQKPGHHKGQVTHRLLSRDIIPFLCHPCWRSAPRVVIPFPHVSEQTFRTMDGLTVYYYSATKIPTPPLQRLHQAVLMPLTSATVLYNRDNTKTPVTTEDWRLQSRFLLASRTFWFVVGLSQRPSTPCLGELHLY